MLTKDLIRCRIDGGRVRPRFIDCTNPGLLELGERLLCVYRADPPPLRGEISDAVQPIVTMWGDAVLAKGLNKLLLDRCDFRHAEAYDYAACRASLFSHAAAALSAGAPAEVTDYREKVESAAALSPGFMEAGIYADLPENDVLDRLRVLSARQLLERYNVGLVQALLLHASDLEIVVSAPDPAALRRLFKYLRFFRLLARVYRQEAVKGAPTGDTMRIVVDGPASVLAQTTRYGLQLASFFPAVCALERWTMDTSVTWKGSPRRLQLSERTGLVCHYRNFSAYVPEEIGLFHRHFLSTVKEWRIVGHTPFLPVGGQEVVFPDLSFEREDGTIVHLELFHRWHAGPLLERLRTLEQRRDFPLIIGVDRALTRDSVVSTALEESPWFGERGFLFRDYPTVERTATCLAKAAEGGVGG